MILLFVGYILIGLMFLIMGFKFLRIKIGNTNLIKQLNQSVIPETQTVKRPRGKGKRSLKISKGIGQPLGIERF